jgi:Eukaryotic protein of unknown function (DUF829)
MSLAMRHSFVVKNERNGFSLHVRARNQASPSGESNGEALPLVVLIGFLGASERIMRSIAKNYEDALDYDTAWTVPPSSVVFSVTDCPKFEYSRALAAAISNLGQGAIILAPFSNAGCFTVRFLHVLLSNSAAVPRDKVTFSRIAGIVYDSCPCVVTSPLVGAKALVSSASPASSQLVNVLIRYPLALMYSSITCISNVLRTGGSIDGMHSSSQYRLYKA